MRKFLISSSTQCYELFDVEEFTHILKYIVKMDYDVNIFVTSDFFEICLTDIPAYMDCLVKLKYKRLSC